MSVIVHRDGRKYRGGMHRKEGATHRQGLFSQEYAMKGVRSFKLFAIGIRLFLVMMMTPLPALAYTNAPPAPQDTSQAGDLYLRLDEGAGATAFVDASGNGHHGTCTGDCPTSGEVGYINQAVRFDGTQSIQVALNAPTGEYTLSAWVKFTGAWTGFHTIMEFGDDAPKFGVASDGALSLGTIVSGGEVPVNEWVYVVYTWDDLYSSLYINGANVIPAVRTPPPTTGAGLRIGKGVGDAGWQGYIDEVRLYDRALTGDEIIALSDGSVLHLAFEEAAGAETFADTSGQGHQGVCSASPCDVGGKVGRLGMAGRFATDYVSVPDVPLGDRFTISAWFQWHGTDKSTNDVQFLIAKGYEHFEIHTEGSTGSNGIRFVPAGYPETHVDVPNFIQPGWNHIAVTYSGDQACVYRNGVRMTCRSQISGGDALTSETAPLSLGRRACGGYRFDGKLDEVRVYARVLSLAEIEALALKMEAPETCGVSSQLMVAGDDELFLMPNNAQEAFVYDQSQQWRSGYAPSLHSYLSDPRFNPVATVMAFDEVWVLRSWNNDDILLYSFDGVSGDWTFRENLSHPAGAVGNPTILSQGTGDAMVFWRAGGALYVREYASSNPVTQEKTWQGWHALPGVTNAASDPVAISRASDHVAVFYRGNDGGVYMSEWRKFEGWGNAPLNLGSPSGTDFASDLMAVSRNDNHVAVLGVTANRQLWIKTWTRGNAADWQDTQWLNLADNVKIDKPAAVSAHPMHLAVAWLHGVNQVYVRQWNPDDGWGPPRDLAGQLQEVVLVSPSSDAVVAIGMNEGQHLYAKNLSDGSWYYIADAWSTEATANLAVVVPNPGDILLVGLRAKLASPSYYGYILETGFAHYSLGGKKSLRSVATTLKGIPQGQTTAYIGEQAHWISVYPDTTNQWTLGSLNLATGERVHLGRLTNHPFSSARYVAVTASDMDGDGDDEVVVATTAHPYLYMSVIKLDASGGQRVLFSSHLYDPRPDVRVAAGELDGQGGNNEVVIVSSNQESFALRIYQYTQGTFQWRRTEVKAYDHRVLFFPSVMTFDVAIGHMREPVLALGYVSWYVPPSHCVFSTCSPPPYTYRLYTWDGPTHALQEVRAWNGSASGQYSRGQIHENFDIALGDVTGDGVNDLVGPLGQTLVGTMLVVLDGADQNRVYELGSKDAEQASHGNFFLAVGDTNKNGRAEIIDSDGRGQVRILEMKAGKGEVKWHKSHKAFGGIPLLADVDGDAVWGQLLGCKTSRDVRVQAVVNGPPRWYDADAPIQAGGFEFGKSSFLGGGHGAGVATTFGGSAAVGYEIEAGGTAALVAGVSVKVFGAYAKLGVEVEGHYDHMMETETVETSARGYPAEQYDDKSAGIVIYRQTMETCYAYDLYSKSRGNGGKMVYCSRPARNLEAMMHLEAWHSNQFKLEAGDSWVDVGRTSNEVLYYPNAKPDEALWVSNDPIAVVKGGGSTSWSYEKEKRDTDTHSGGFMISAFAEAGGSLAGVTADFAIHAGAGGEYNSWTVRGEGVNYGGQVAYIPATCSTCRAYQIVPYLQEAQAKTRSGQRYPYIEVDYYVPWINTTTTAETPVAGTVRESTPAPQPPLITSPTHPDPDTWYLTNTVTFAWAQPASDPVTGTTYSWMLLPHLNWQTSQPPTVTHTPLGGVVTPTFTYRDVPDGVHYLFVQAEAPGGGRSPVAQRVVRVDTMSPQVQIARSPSHASGDEGWYNTPVTVTLTATDTGGSGVALVEYSMDGTTWQPYTAALLFASETPATTLWARATDHVGYVSAVVSTSFKIDMTPPDSGDLDGYGISYAAFVTDTVGNEQLVLGGVLTDALSGRDVMNVQAGAIAPWRGIDARGEMPMPSNNVFTSSETALNWIYTPTFEVHGIYPLYGQGGDVAGNQEEAYELGTYFWYPESGARFAPDLSESAVSVSPQRVQPGAVIASVIALRNRGFQEARVAVRDVLPAGLTPLPETISDGGVYANGAISWTYPVVWPGQTHYLLFKAQVDPALTGSSPITLENRVEIQPYWPGLEEEADYILPVHVVTSTLEVQAASQKAHSRAVSGGAAGENESPSAPRIFEANVWDGEIVMEREVELFIDASVDAEFIGVQEWAWDTDAHDWVLAQESGWVPFVAGDDFEVYEDEIGRYGWYRWQLSEGDGVKYLGVWVADADKQTSNLNEGNMIYTNLLDREGQTLATGERKQYRVHVDAGGLAIFNLVLFGGDADVVVWKPRNGFHPNYVSQEGFDSGPGGIRINTAAFFAEEDGLHIVEVEALADTQYRLAVSGDVGDFATLASNIARGPEQLSALETYLVQHSENVRQSMVTEGVLTLASPAGNGTIIIRNPHPTTLSTPFKRDPSAPSDVPDVALVPDLQIGKYVAKDGAYTVALGRTITYTIRLTNRGTAPAYDVSVRDPLPSGISFGVWVTQPPAATFSSSDNTVRWDAAVITTSQVYTLSFTARVTDDPGFAGRVMTNTVVYAAPNEMTGAASVAFMIEALEAPTSLTVTTARTTLAPSESTLVTATLRNAGGDLFVGAATITFTSSLGEVAPQGVAATNGIAMTTFSAGTITGTATITATRDHLADTTTVVVQSLERTNRVYLPLVMRMSQSH